MNIDKNNWFIRLSGLTEKQYMDVCKYLVENYEAGVYPNTVYSTATGSLPPYNSSVWDYVGVERKGFTVEYTNDYGVSVITYQDFLNYIKEPEWILWSGGECPVDPKTHVEVELDSGYIVKGPAKSFRWYLTGININYDDIVKYRTLSAPVSKPDTNLQTTPESPVSSLTETLEWIFEYNVDHVEATDTTLTIVHHRVGKIIVDIDVDFEDIESMLKGLEDN